MQNNKTPLRIFSVGDVVSFVNKRIDWMDRKDIEQSINQYTPVTVDIIDVIGIIDEIYDERERKMVEEWQNL